MAALMRGTDWARTPLGPPMGWPPSLRTLVSVMLGNPFPMCICWGVELRQLYNDGYRQLLGRKHPRALGQPARESWAEIWHVVGPMAEGTLTGGPGALSRDLLLEVDRHGYVEEAYFTFSFSPILDGGMLVTAQETTDRVLGERRLRALRDLAAAGGDARSADEVCASAAAVLASNPADMPFALLYLLEGDGAGARLAGAAGLDDTEGSAVLADASWPVAEVHASGRAVVVPDLAGVRGLQDGRASSALVLPLARHGVL